jgi:integral membrane protein (TIGR01906 family)
MNQEDNLRATAALLDYLRGKRDDIVVRAKVSGVEREVFNERETLHMVDVRALYQKAQLARNIAAVLGIAILVFLTYYEKKKLREVMKAGFVSGVSAMLAFVVFVAVWALADFDQFWTNFHLMLFDNDLWLLDPRTSIMINLFPATFFFDLVIRIILIFLFLMIAASFFIFQPWRRS